MPMQAAVIGAGTVSDNHISGIQKNPKTNLMGICDVDEGLAKRTAKDANTVAYTSLDDVIDDGVDLIHICTPIQTHHNIAKKAMESGVAVLIEKPLTNTVEEAENLIGISERENVPGGVVHTHLYDPQVRKVREMIKTGELGQIEGVDIIYSGLSSPDDVNRGSWVFELPGGEFEEGLPHPIYMGLGLAGFPESSDRISAITGLSEDYDQGFSYDSAQVQYRSEKGTLCSIKMLSKSPEQRVVMIHGSRKTIILNMINLSIQVIDEVYSDSAVSRAKKSFDTSLAQLKGLVDAATYMGKLKTDSSWENESQYRRHYGVFRDFVNALENSSQPPVPLLQGKWTIQIMEEVRNKGSI